MSENDSINKPNSELTDDKLFGMLSQLHVPPSPLGKEENWEKIMLGVERQTRWDRFKIGFTRWGAAAVVLIIVSSVLIEWQFSTKTLESPNGKMAYILLPDSSRVTLNAGSVIKHKEFGFKRKRVVTLEGEALFDVRSGEVDFVVIAGDNTIRVLGTQFNVFHRNDVLEVKCLKGEVEVKIDELALQNLTAGRGISFTPETSIVKELPFDSHNAAAWTKGEFYYSESTLSAVLDEIERQFNVKIEVQGFDPESRLYSGYFTNEQIRNALDLVCVPMGLMYEMDYQAGVVRVYPMGY